MILGVLIIAYSLCIIVASEGVLLVPSCRSAKGDGRCVPSPECCKLVGGSIVTPVAERPCGSKDVCCYIVPTVPDTDESCSVCAALLTVTDLKPNKTTSSGVMSHSTAKETTTFSTTTPTTTTSRISTIGDVGLPPADDSNNLIRAFMPSTRDDAEPAEIKSPVTFFARSADVGFGVPYRIERTIFDKDAMKNTYCWQVALVDSSGKIFGGGALISKNYVVTAAHKVANRLPQNFQVVLGKYDFKDQEEDSRIASPLEVIIHEKWDPSAFENNIALIRIPNVNCNAKDICTICPSDSPVDPVAQAQDICFVTGWGSTYTKGDLEKLQQNQIRPIGNDECIKGLERSSIQDFVVPQTMFCGSSGDPDRLACDGDGGAPLVCMRSGAWTWELRGLVALGVSFCVNITDAPTVYTDVGRLSGWISRKIHELETEPHPWARPTTPQATTTAVPTTTSSPIMPQKSPVLNRRTNDNTLSFSYVFPSFLRHLDDDPEP